MSVNELINLYHVRLKDLFAQREIQTMCNMVLENKMFWNKAQILVNRDFVLPLDKREALLNILKRLEQQEPIQYIFKEADFYGMKLKVTQDVLIPRPETEELVEWILEDMDENKPYQILDIGTGSGCIALAIKKEKPDTCLMTAIDIGSGALNIARFNAEKYDLDITFIQADILNEAEWPKLAHYDIIVSNPPYVLEVERNMMTKNVLDYEPGLALFVPDDNPLLFYETIARFSKSHLKYKGLIYFEINEFYLYEYIKMFKNMGFSKIEAKEDINGKKRMLRIAGK